MAPTAPAPPRKSDCMQNDAESRASASIISGVIVLPQPAMRKTNGQPFIRNRLIKVFTGFLSLARWRSQSVLRQQAVLLEPAGSKGGEKSADRSDRHHPLGRKLTIGHAEDALQDPDQQRCDRAAAQRATDRCRGYLGVDGVQ